LKDIWLSALITIGLWAILFLLVKFLSRYVLLIKKLLLQLSLLIAIVGLIFFFHYSHLALSPGWPEAIFTALVVVVAWSILKPLFILPGFI